MVSPRFESVERSHIGPRNVRSLTGFNAAEYADLTRLGIDIRHAEQMAQSFRQFESMTAMDSLVAPLTTSSITTPVQFLQTWLPGFVEYITAARKIDELVGITTAGAWEDEEVVQGFLELTGTAVPYGDYTNVPFSSWNTNFGIRNVVRFEEGMRVGVLEEARAGRIRMNSAATKREAASRALEIQRNAVGFYGFNSGSNYTYGFLNDPGAPAFVEFANGATSGSPAWSTKTFLDIQTDLRLMISNLRNQTLDVVDVTKIPTILALSTNTIDYLSVTTNLGYSVRQWLTETYPKCTVESAPELNNAHASLNVAYLYAEAFKEQSTDNGRVWDQYIPTKFRTIGVQQMAKGYEEDYSNATAGVWLKRPLGLVRFYGN